eukprot:s127_g13.t1
MLCGRVASSFSPVAAPFDAPSIFFCEFQATGSQRQDTGGAFSENPCAFCQIRCKLHQLANEIDLRSPQPMLPLFLPARPSSQPYVSAHEDFQGAVEAKKCDPSLNQRFRKRKCQM